MRKLSAHYLISPGQPPLRNGILDVDEDGTILRIRENTSGAEEGRVEFFSGILVPGFVNVHTHLELSHLKGLIPQHTGLSGFVGEVVSLRKQTQADERPVATQLALMHQSGIQAVGDIANTRLSLIPKTKSPVRSHTFVELFGLEPDQSERIWENGQTIRKDFQDAELPASVTPHSPYSLSATLWKKFTGEALHHELLSIHHAESPEEDELITLGTGPLAKRFQSIGIQERELPGPSPSTTQWLSQQLPKAKNILLIHNTFMKEAAAEFLQQHHPDTSFYFGVCPNANLYIENALPQTLIRQRAELCICIGTDSLASNRQLSVWEEIKTLAKAFPELSLTELISWATLNGAKALGMDTEIGSFSPGKKPGVVLLEGTDLRKLSVTPESTSRRIV